MVLKLWSRKNMGHNRDTIACDSTSTRNTPNEQIIKQKCEINKSERDRKEKGTEIA